MKSPVQINKNQFDMWETPQRAVDNIQLTNVIPINSARDKIETENEHRLQTLELPPVII